LPITIVSALPAWCDQWRPTRPGDTNNQLIDNFSWKLNKHDLKFGFEYRRTTIKQYFDKYFRGS